jgi:hypothetical protein
MLLLLRDARTSDAAVDTERSSSDDPTLGIAAGLSSGVTAARFRIGFIVPAGTKGVENARCQWGMKVSEDVGTIFQSREAWHP